MSKESKLSEEKLREIFTSASGNEPVFVGFMDLLKEHADMNKLAAFQPNLSAEDRAYNCGRAAAIEDVLFSVANYDAKNLLTNSGSDTNSDSQVS